MSQASIQPAIDKVPAPPSAVLPEAARWEQFSGLPCSISVDVPVPGFTLRDLIALRPGSIISTKFQTSSGVPLHANRVLIAWCDFEAMGKWLSVRLTELV